jgi:hypothetical protein
MENMELLSNIKRIIKVPKDEKRMFFKAFFLSIIIKGIVFILPFKFYCFLFKTKPTFLIPEKELDQTIRSAKKTMRRVVRFSPWNYSCLVKSLTMKILLNSIGIESRARLGVLKPDLQLLSAHASICINNHTEYLKNEAFKWHFTL